MKHLKNCALGALLVAGFVGAAAAQDQPRPNTELQFKARHAGEINLAATTPCTLARMVAGQLGLLAPEVGPLPNEQAFGAANGALKVVVACGMTGDESYTYERLLSNLGLRLLAFKGDEPPQKVVQELAASLKLSKQTDPAQTPAFKRLFAGQGATQQAIRLGIQPAALAAAADKAPLAKGGSETLYDLFLLAKSGDPELGRSRSRLLISEAETDMARSALRPRVTADFGTSYINQSTYHIGPSQNSTVTGYNYDVVASMPILHIPSYYNLASAKATARGEEAGVITANQNLINRLTQSYFAVLKAGGDKQIAREELSRVKQALEQAQAFLRAGTGDIIAVYEAQARLDSVVADLTRSESSLTIAEQTLSSIVGKVVTSIADHRLKQPMLPAPNDLEWWLATMEERDPQIRQAQENLAAVTQQTKSAQAEHLPVVDANAGFDDSKGAAFAPTAETRQWHVGAVVTLPLYSGGETSARVRRATASETERRYLLDQVRQQRRESVKQAFFNLRYNVSLIAALEQKEASALVQLNAVRKGRSIGTRTAIDLLNAEQAFSVAQRDLKNALYDNVIRVIELKAAAGVLSEEDIRY